MAKASGIGQKNLHRFIAMQRKTFEATGLGRWESCDWSHYNDGKSLTFYKDRSRGQSKGVKLDNDYGYQDFAKALAVMERSKGRVGDHPMKVIRMLEGILLSDKGRADPSLIDDQVIESLIANCRKLTESTGTLYSRGSGILRIVKAVNEFNLSAAPLSLSKNPFPRRKDYHVKYKADVAKKLPDQKVIDCVGELFHQGPGHPKDIVTTSMFAILLSAPSRANELLELPVDCVNKEVSPATDKTYMTLTWFGSKGYGYTSKAIPQAMHEVVETAVDRVRLISEEPRKLAKHFEEHPDTLPLHLLTENEAIRSISQDKPLGFDRFNEVLANPDKGGAENFKRFLVNAQGLVKKKMERLPDSAYLTGAKNLIEQQLTLLPDPKDTGLPRFNGRIAPHTVRQFKEANWTFILSCRELNWIIRAAYLPAFFPFITSRRLLKFSDALFCFFENQLHRSDAHDAIRFRLLDMDHTWFLRALSGAQGWLSHESSTLVKNFPDIFGGQNVGFGSHELRRLLNTMAFRSDVSGQEIAAWSSRADERQNTYYNQIDDDEMVERTKALIKKDRIIETHEIVVHSDPNIEEITLMAEQETPFGRCRSPWSVAPCELAGDCIGCDALACIKGEKEKEQNIRAEVGRYQKRLRRALRADQSGNFGASHWVEYYVKKITRGEELLAIFDDESIEDGALIVARPKGDGPESATHRALQNGGYTEKNTSELKLDLKSIMALTGEKK